MYSYTSLLFVLCSFFLLGSSLTDEHAQEIQMFLAPIFKNAQIEKGNVWLPSMILRLSFHDAGTWRSESETGGPRSALSQECISIEASNCEKADPENKGLDGAVQFLEGVLDQFSHTGISRADLWQLAACVVIEVAGGPHLDFKAGREDSPASEGFPGRLPSAHHSWEQIVERMGPGALDLTNEEIIALQGAHTLGFLHKKTSKFAGQWDGTPTLWDTEYFKGLTRVFNGFWPKRSDGARHLVLSSHLMLPSDIAGFKKFPEIVKRFANDLGHFNKVFATAFAKLQNNGNAELHDVDLPKLPKDLIRTEPKHCKGFLRLLCLVQNFRGHGPNGQIWERPLQNLHKIFPKVIKGKIAFVKKVIGGKKEIIKDVVQGKIAAIKGAHSIVKGVVSDIKDGNLHKNLGQHIKKAVDLGKKVIAGKKAIVHKVFQGKKAVVHKVIQGKKAIVHHVATKIHEKIKHIGNFFKGLGKKRAQREN